MSLSTRLEIVSEQLRKMKRAGFSFPSLPPSHLRLRMPSILYHTVPQTLYLESQSPFIPIPGKTGVVQRSVKGADLTEGSPAPPSGEVTEHR